MQKTATVTVSRWVTHKVTGKVRRKVVVAYTKNSYPEQSIQRSRKFLVHDELDSMSAL